MKRFRLEQSGRDVVTSHSGLALVGLCLNRHTDLAARANEAVPCAGIATVDVLRTAVGLLTLGQSDFEAATGKREDRYFRQALGIATAPSAETLRQRLDACPEVVRLAVADATTELVRRAKAAVTGLATGHVPLDCDGTPMDNSKTRKEGVSYTYQGYDGYAPMAAYLGQEGWCLELELRPGSQHAQKGFLPFLHRVLYRARRIVGPERRLLVRLDSAHDAQKTRVELANADATDWIVKWNPRKQDVEAWWKRAETEQAIVTDPQKPGRRTALLEDTLTCQKGDRTYAFRRLVRVVERTVDRKGQPLLLPERELEGWWTSLDSPAAEVISLYHDHGTAEQFHSELKTDMDIERLPSGQFATHALMLALAGLAYNILRLIGQIGLLGDWARVRHPAKRRRLRTVMQELMYLAARVIRSGHRLVLRFASHCPGFAAFEVAYARLATG
jgi:hypothetical protein